MVDQVEFDDEEIRIVGQADALERLVMGGGVTPVEYPVRKWRARNDSSVRPPDS
jgi:site-specific DNA recombinase